MLYLFFNIEFEELIAHDYIFLILKKYKMLFYFPTCAKYYFYIHLKCKEKHIGHV